MSDAWMTGWLISSLARIAAIALRHSLPPFEPKGRLHETSPSILSHTQATPGLASPSPLRFSRFIMVMSGVAIRVPSHLQKQRRRGVGPRWLDALYFLFLVFLFCLLFSARRGWDFYTCYMLCWQRVVAVEDVRRGSR